MTGPRSPRRRPVLAQATLFLAVVLVVGALVWRVAYVQALGPLSARGQADLALAADRLTGQLQRYQEMAVLLSEHPTLSALHGGGDRAAADALLLEIKDKTSALTLSYRDRHGMVLAAAAPLASGTDTTGQTTTRPAAALPEPALSKAAVARAMTGALGSAYGHSDALGARVYLFAAPAFGPDGTVQGTLLVGADIEGVEWEWRGDRPAIYFTDPDGEVFITNRSELLGWHHPKEHIGLAPQPLENDMSARDQSAASHLATSRTHSTTLARSIGAHEIWHVDWSPYVPQTALVLRRDLPVINLTGMALIDVAPAMRLAWLQAVAVMGLLAASGAVLFLATERRRALAAANVVLEAQVARRTKALLEANDALRKEVVEREDAEAQLKRAQADLVQAGKLSALGQLSAGLAHELNQPLMATLSFAENGQAFLDRGAPERTRENLGRIADLTRRMDRIIRNLRAFARQEAEPASNVDLCTIIEHALELTEGLRKRADITLEWRAPNQPIWVRGGEVRLGQVLVNLITNACDAMAGQATRTLSLTLLDHGSDVHLVVADTGPGIAEPDRIFDPFYTTKEVGSETATGEGMGLGLSISYGLVQSFGGAIRGRNRDDLSGQSGAEFVLELRRTAHQAAAE